MKKHANNKTKKVLQKCMVITMTVAFGITSIPMNIVSVNAKSEVRKVKSVSIVKPTTDVFVLKKGSTSSLRVKIAPSNAINKNVTYVSSNKKIVSVNQKGKIKALKKGKATIKVIAKDGSKKSDKIVVYVGNPITKIRTTKNVTIQKGDTYELETTISPRGATYKKVAYKSSNKKVATVTKEGVIQAKKAGKATITISALDGNGVKATCKVKVKKQEQEGKPEVPGTTIPQYDGYQLVWNDEFAGESLNFNDWQYEPHEPGWVNNELQEYTESTDNVYVEDGKLVIQALKNEDGETTTYTSGKVTTQNKQDFKYGRIEASIKVPEGQGLWPAFWMMPTEQDFYGEWPKCGEIDIMEVLGHETNKAYGTIHYGEPHKESQGTYVLEDSKFSDDYHLYSVEWEPGKMKFYIDNKLYHEVDDWYTSIEGEDELTFPAPFDQTFFLQFNLAIGGNWPGNPDETTDFDNAKLMVDYVRVYQKDSYDENVTKPEKAPVEFREPDSTGNYMINGDFSVAEEVNDQQDWQFLLAGKGAATAQIKDNTMRIETTDAGELDYSVQLVQDKLPLKQGGVYEVSFDAKADEDRSIIVGVTGPDNSYVRYMQDTKQELTTENKTYTFKFTMEENDDANARLEYNLGNQGSIAGVEIRNVRLKQVGEVEVNNTVPVLKNGNFIHNGTFDVGENRLGYWEITSNQGVTMNAVVTNKDYKKRELKIEADNVEKVEDIIVQQKTEVLSPNTKYVLTFEAYADEAKNIKTTIGGKTFDATLTGEKKEFKYEFKTGASLEENDKVLRLLLGNNGVTYIDNVMLKEVSNIINGNFNLGTAGWELYKYDSTSSNFEVLEDEKEGSIARIAIDHTGNADWHIQLKQGNLKLEQGKCYKISVRAKSDVPRTIQFALQRNGQSDDNWIPYSNTLFWKLTEEFDTFTKKFKMEHDTDIDVIASLTLGAVKGEELKNHNVDVSYILVEEIPESELQQ